MYVTVQTKYKRVTHRVIVRYKLMKKSPKSVGEYDIGDIIIGRVFMLNKTLFRLCPYGKYLFSILIYVFKSIINIFDIYDNIFLWNIFLLFTTISPPKMAAVKWFREKRLGGDEERFWSYYSSQ